jgi:hypothetical protein
LFRQHRKTSAAIEELHSELSLQIRESLAHGRLSTPQAAAGEVVARFAPDVTADDPRLVSAIDGELAKSA